MVRRASRGDTGDAASRKAKPVNDPWSLVAEAVDERRRQLGMTWRQVADAGGPSEQTMQKLRHQGVPIGEVTQTRLCRALGWEPDGIARLLVGAEPVEAVRQSESLDERLDRVADALEALREVQHRQSGAIEALIAEIREERTSRSSRQPRPRAG